MSDPPRQVPPPFPRVSVQQRGNAISVRQKPDQDAGWGTLQHPKRFELPLLSPHRIKSRLGFEAVPASEFWQFTVAGKVKLQVNRLSADRYANSVGVALLDQNNQRVAPLVQSASGRGEPVEIEAGTYKVVAALGIAENLKDLVFEFLASPIGARLRSTAVIDFPLVARLQDRDRSLVGLGAFQLMVGTGRLHAGPAGSGAAGGSHLKGRGDVTVGGAGTLQAPGQSLRGVAAGAVPATGHLRARRTQVIRGIGLAAGLGHGFLVPVRWLNEPHNPWRARAVGGVCELNRAYVRFDVGITEQQRLLQQIATALS